MKGRQIIYTAAELEWLEANRTLVIDEYARRFNERFGREVAAQNLHALRKRKGWSTGRTGCFEKGAAPHNKGKKCEPGKGGLHPNARKTQFRKGERKGVAVKLWKPVGTERIAKDGYLERKINDDLPLQGRWRAVHLIEWEAANGPIPEGHCLKCLDGNKLNTDAANWACIPRAWLPRLVGGNRYRDILAFDDAPPELRPILLTLAKLEDETRAATKRAAA